MLELNWTGPFRVSDYLANSINDEWAGRWPPPSDGVYFVSRHQWEGVPTEASGPLYVGGNTGKSNRFCTRVGDLIADIYGFFDGGTGHHSGGRKVWSWCNESRVEPGSLWLAWTNSGTPWCARCAERALHAKFRTSLLNEREPSGCGSGICYAGSTTAR